MCLFYYVKYLCNCRYEYITTRYEYITSYRIGVAIFFLIVVSLIGQKIRVASNAYASRELFVRFCDRSSKLELETPVSASFSRICNECVSMYKNAPLRPTVDALCISWKGRIIVRSMHIIIK